MKLRALAVGLAGILGGLFAVKRLSNEPEPDITTHPPERIQARHYQRVGRQSIQAIVLHATSPATGDPCAPGAARATAHFFANQDDTHPTSAHYVVGPDETLQCVDDTDIAWHAKGINDTAIGVEITGSSKWTRAQWEACDVIPRAVELVHALAAKWSIPIRFLDAAALLRGERGITTHAEVTKAWHKTDHTDPGAGFPIDAFVPIA